MGLGVTDRNISPVSDNEIIYSYICTWISSEKKSSSMVSHNGTAHKCKPTSSVRLNPSEYVQEMSQSKNEDQPTEPRERDT